MPWMSLLMANVDLGLACSHSFSPVTEVSGAVLCSAVRQSTGAVCLLTIRLCPMSLVLKELIVLQDVTGCLLDSTTLY